MQAPVDDAVVKEDVVVPTTLHAAVWLQGVL